jgi:outer membrane protein
MDFDRAQEPARSAARMRLHIASSLALVAALGCCVEISSLREARAETILGALAKAYSDNPDLDEQRANVRVRDEDLPKAAAGMMPKASISVNGGPQISRVRQPAGRDRFNHRQFTDDHMFGQPRGGNIAVTHPLFDGWRTENSMRQAESGIFAARANMRASEQEVLQNAATAYMNVMRDAAVVSLRKNNIAVLRRQLRVTRDRQELGEVTMTDVAQAEAALAQGKSDYFAAQSALENSRAYYEQVIGDAPKNLEPPSSIEHLLPRSREDAIDAAEARHPMIMASLHQLDAAASAVKVAEGALLPTVSVTAQVNQQFDSYLGYPGTKQFLAQVNGQLNVPIYQGGAEYASVRQAKQQAGQTQIHVSAQRNAVRSAVVQAFGQLAAAKASMASNAAAARAAEIALKGVRDEAAFGQRTTLDVLNAQQALLNARVNLVTSQRDRVVASYALLATIGGLSASTLSLDVEIYDPLVNFNQVKWKWIGVSTSDGR